MLTFNLGPAIVGLNGILARIAHPEPALAIIGARARESVRQRIQRTKTDPDGNRWAPWADDTRAEREHKGNAGQGLLWDDGSLLDSIAALADDDSVEIGSPLDYAGYLQDGTRRMPARPYLGWTGDDLVQAADTLLHYIEGPL